MFPIGSPLRFPPVVLGSLFDGLPTLARSLVRTDMLALFSSSPSLLVPSTALRTRAVRMADIGDTGVSFENVAREWRCKYTAGASGGPGDSASLKACQALLDEYLPKIKALPKASVTRQVCGGCLDFKVSITQPLDEHRALSKKKAHGREDRPACPSG